MSYSSILFSREHLINPVTLNRAGKKISIQDKKIQTIAIAMIAGLIKGGYKGGVVGALLFYC